MLNNKIIKRNSPIIGVLLMSAVSQLTHAETGNYFMHKDWELACDNTGMCRAVGYQSDAQFGHPVSLLISRPAGAGSAVLSQIQVAEEFTQDTEANLNVGGTSLGSLTIDAKKSTAKLSSAQSALLLKALVGAEDIRLTTQAQQWQISTAGANAVLLKMDDIQKRVNTPNAVYQKGNQSEQNVLQPKAIPQIGITGYRPAVASHFAVDSKIGNQLFKKIKGGQSLAPLCFAVRQQLECEQRSRLCEREQRFIELEHELRGASEILLVKLIGDPAQVRDYHRHSPRDSSLGNSMIIYIY